MLPVSAEGSGFLGPELQTSGKAQAMVLTSHARSGIARAVVLGVESRAHKQRDLEAALGRFEIAVRWAEEPVHHNGSTTLPIAIVGISAGPVDGAFDDRYRHVSRFAAAGCRVAAYADGCDKWTIGERCHAIVLGANTLLDSSSASFPRQVAALVSSWVSEVSDTANAELEQRTLMSELGIVGHSAAVSRTLTQIRRAASLSELPVLLVGETGSGKELMARALHRLDPQRCKGPLVTVNCAAIPPELAEDELFGHKRGAFTGAHRDKRGLFRAADGGVLFLDEVGELRSDIQGKLLRAIQQQCVMPVGTEEEVSVDVRIVAATHRDLVALVHAGNFREDLYYRLCVLPIAVPPLRERQEDIAEIVDHILSRHGERHDGRPPLATDAFREALSACALPGNVRQLENIVQQAIVRAAGGATLDLVHLPSELLHSLDCDSPMSPTVCAPPVEVERRSLLQVFSDEGWNLERCVDSFERSLVATAYSRSNGNQTATARLLGVTPRCIYTKLRKHSLL